MAKRLLLLLFLLIQRTLNNSQRAATRRYTNRMPKPWEQDRLEVRLRWRRKLNDTCRTQVENIETIQRLLGKDISKICRLKSKKWIFARNFDFVEVCVHLMASIGHERWWCTCGFGWLEEFIYYTRAGNVTFIVFKDKIYVDGGVIASRPKVVLLHYYYSHLLSPRVCLLEKIFNFSFLIYFMMIFVLCLSYMMISRYFLLFLCCCCCCLCMYF